MPARDTETLTIGEHRVQISNSDKILFPATGITKGEYVDYYQRIAPYMLEHIRDRPLSMERFPEGIEGEKFYQKEVPKYFPEYVKRVDVKPDEETPTLYAMAENEASIVYLANLVTIPHIWMSCTSDLRKPDRMVWDLDPMDLSFAEVKMAAKLLRYLLNELGVNGYPMLTGSRGIHIVAFVPPEEDVETIFDFTKKVAQLITRKLPRLFTVTYTKSKRGKKIYVDYHRNVYAQTAVAPYAARAIEGAPIAFPVTWEDVDDDKLDAQTFTIRNVSERLDAEGISWSHIERVRDLGSARERLGELLHRSRISG